MAKVVDTGRTPEELDSLGRYRNLLSEYNGAYGIEYERYRDSLKFATGEQWDERQRRRRANDKGRPTLTNNFTKPYIDRIVNPFILDPVSPTVSADIPSAPILKEEIRGVENKSNAHESYQTAFWNAVACGRGFIHVGTEYANDYNMDQSISVDTIRDPLSCYLDPASEEVDGSDACSGIYIKYLDTKSAKKKYGNDIGTSGVDVYQYWQVPNDTTPSVLFYEKFYKNTKRNFLSNGEYIDGEIPDNVVMPLDVQVVGTRNIEIPYIRCTHVVGDKIISSTDYDMPYIPIVPVVGYRMFTEYGLQYGGIVDMVRDSQVMVNYYVSSEAEAAALTPKAPWLITEGQIEGYEKIWKTANTKTYDALIYKPETLGGQMVPSPERTDARAQTEGLINSKNAAIQDMSRETSIFDPMFGQKDSSDESGVALMNRSRQGEIATAHFTDNLMKSIKQCGRVMLWLMNNVYDTTRTVTVEDEEVQYRWKDLSLNLKDLMLEVATGPSVETRKKESVIVLQEMIATNPQAAPLLNIRLVENLNVPNKEAIIEDLKKLLPPELQDSKGNIPPEAMQAMEAAQQAVTDLEGQNEYLMGIIQQLQASIIDDDKDRMAKLASDQIKSNTSLAETRMKVEGDLQKVREQNKGKMGTEALKQSNENQRTIAEIEASAESDNKKIISDAFKAPTTTEVTETTNITVDDIIPRAPGPVVREDLGTDTVIEDIDEILGE